MPAQPAALGSYADVAKLTKEQVAELLSDMPDPCSCGHGAKLRCLACFREYKTASGLIQHLLNKHEVDREWLKDSKLSHARALEFSAASKKRKPFKAYGTATSTGIVGKVKKEAVPGSGHEPANSNGFVGSFNAKAVPGLQHEPANSMGFVGSVKAEAAPSLIQEPASSVGFVSNFKAKAVPGLKHEPGVPVHDKKYVKKLKQERGESRETVFTKQKAIGMAPGFRHDEIPQPPEALPIQHSANRQSEVPLQNVLLGKLREFLFKLDPIAHVCRDLACPICLSPIKKAQGLLRHLEVNHEIPHTALANTSLDLLARLQRSPRFNPLPVLTDDESKHLSPLWNSGALRVTCRLCANGNEIPKRNILRHFTEKHQRAGEDLCLWQSVLDGRYLQDVRIPPPDIIGHCRFEVAHHLGELKVAAAADKVATASPSTQSGVLMKEEPFDRMAIAFEKIAVNITSLAGGTGADGWGAEGPDGDIILPNVNIREAVLAWGGYGKSHRKQWPKEFRMFPCPYNFVEFREFLKGVRHLKNGSEKLYIQGVTYFIQMFEIPENAPELDVICALWKKGCMRKLMGHEALNPKYSFTGKIAGGLTHLCNHLRLEAAKTDTRRSRRLAGYVTAFMLEMVSSLVSSARVQRRGLLVAREDAIARNIAKLAKQRALIRKGIQLAYIDAYNIITSHVTTEGGSAKACPPQLRNAVNTWFVFVVFMDTLAGRPGGFERMSDKEGQEMLNSESDIVDKYLLAEDHKTVLRYGPQPKYLTPAQVRLVSLMESLKRNGSGLFLEPGYWRPDLGTDQKVFCSKILQKACGIYVPELQVKVTCTLLRELQTSLADDVDKALQRELRELCIIDGNSLDTRQKYYLKKPYTKKASDSKNKFAKLACAPLPTAHTSMI